jgi:hypothetical protein
MVNCQSFIEQEEWDKRKEDQEMLKEIELMNLDIFNLKIQIGTNYLQ